MTHTPAETRRRARAGRSPIAAGFAVAALVLAGCGGNDGPIVIGLVGPFAQPEGHSARLAAELAVQEINAAGPPLGRQLELRIMDDSASSARAIVIATTLRDDPSIVAVVGHLTSATTIAAADIYNAGRHPVVEISPAASNPALSGIGPYTMRVCATDQAHGTALARHAVERLQARTVAIIYQNDDYGRGIVATFRAELTRLGGTVASQDPVLDAATNATPYIERLQRDNRIQAVMLATDRETAAGLLRQLRQRGMTIPVLGGDGLTGIESEGALAEGVYLTSNYLPDRPGDVNARFVRAYAAAYDGERPDDAGAGAYDAVYLIADALRAGGADRAALRNALVAVGGDRPAYEGVTGRVAFDAMGDVRDKTVVVGVVRHGAITLATTP